MEGLTAGSLAGGAGQGLGSASCRGCRGGKGCGGRPGQCRNGRTGWGCGQRNGLAASRGHGWSRTGRNSRSGGGTSGGPGRTEGRRWSRWTGARSQGHRGGRGINTGSIGAQGDPDGFLFQGNSGSFRGDSHGRGLLGGWRDVVFFLAHGKLGREEIKFTRINGSSCPRCQPLEKNRKNWKWKKQILCRNSEMGAVERRKSDDFSALAHDADLVGNDLQGLAGGFG